MSIERKKSCRHYLRCEQIFKNILINYEEGIKLNGTRYGEKMYETLLMNEGYVHAVTFVVHRKSKNVKIAGSVGEVMERGIIVYSNSGIDIDIHINCWYEFSKGKEIVLDFGLMIHDEGNAFSEIELFVPFKVHKVKELGHLLYEPEILKTVFNKQYDISVPRNWNDFFLAKDDNSVQKESFAIYRNINQNWPKDEMGAGTIIKIKPAQESMNGLHDGAEKTDHYYFRFRVIIEFREFETIFGYIKTKGSFLKTEIDNRVLADIRINNERDVSRELENTIMNKKLTICKINSLRFFLIAPREYDLITTLDNNYHTTRRIENELWDKYLDSDYQLKNSNLCYYWKLINDSSENTHLSVLFEMRIKESDIKTIVVYIVVLIIINILCSMGGSYIYDHLRGGNEVEDCQDKTENSVGESAISIDSDIEN